MATLFKRASGKFSGFIDATAYDNEYSDFDAAGRVCSARKKFVRPLKRPFPSKHIMGGAFMRRPSPL